MNHGDLVNLYFGIHCPILLASLVAYYRLGDHGHAQLTATAAINDTLTQIRRKISVSLAERLEPVFSDPDSVVRVTQICGPDGKPYTEENVSPVGSERYREAIFRFVEQRSGPMADCRSLGLLRSSWLRWLRLRGWSVLGIVAWQCVSVGPTFFCEILFRRPIPDWLLKCSFFPTALLVVLFVAAAMSLEIEKNRIANIRMKYDVP